MFRGEKDVTSQSRVSCRSYAFADYRDGRSAPSESVFLRCMQDPEGVQNAEVLQLALDLAGVATPPFAPCLLPGQHPLSPHVKEFNHYPLGFWECEFRV